MRAPSKPGPVMIVDDDGDVLAALRFALEAEGYEVEAFATAAALAAAAGLTKAACLVVDQKLPDVSGLELIQQIRSRGVVVPAVLITTQLATHLRWQAARLAVPIVEKPLLSDTLFTTIRDLIADEV